MAFPPSHPMPFPPSNSKNPSVNQADAKPRQRWGTSVGQELQTAYMRQISMYPILSPEEEYKWAKQYADSKEILFGLLRELPAVCCAVIKWLSDPQVKIRMGNYFSIAGDTTDNDEDTNLKELFADVSKRISVITQKSNSDANYAKEVSGAILPLIPREPFYASCLELLNDDSKRPLLIDEGEWLSLKPKLEKAQADMKQASNILVERNLRLVISIAGHYMGSGIPLADLVQEGNIGLIRSVERFDYHRGHRFSTYASYWIRQAITRNITNHSKIIRMPANTVTQISQIRQAEQRLLSLNGEIPTVEEIAQETNLSPTKIRALKKMAQQPLSLQSILAEDKTLEDTIPDPDNLQPSEHADMATLRESLRKIVGSLDPREQRIIKLRFGLEDGECHTLVSISQEMGLSSERVRQIEAAAMHKMRLPGSIELLEGYNL